MVQPQAGSFSIIAATCYGNRGAEAMLETVIGRLRQREPTLRFEVFSYYPADDRRLVDDPCIRIHSSTPLALVAWLLPWSLLFGLLRLVFGRRVLGVAPAAIRALGGSRALVDLAGVAFIDGREKFLPFNFLTLLPAWLLGTPIVKMPQAVGPFDGRLNRAVARFMLPRCTMVWARGDRTRQHLAGSGFPRLRFAQADDIAFNFDGAWSLTSEAAAELPEVLRRIGALRGEAGVRGVVGICPSAVLAARARRQGGGYESALSRLVCGLAAQGHAVVLFPNATRARDGDAERNNDLPLMRRIRANCIQAGIVREPVLVDFDINAAGIKQVLAAMDVLLVSRFHAMVGALSLGIPTAVLGWSHKYAEVMERFGLGDHVMDYRALDDAQLLEAVRVVFDDRVAIRDSILAALPRVRASADLPVLGLLEPGLGTVHA